MPNKLTTEDLAAVQPSQRAPFTAAFTGNEVAKAFADRHPPRAAAKTAEDFAALAPGAAKSGGNAR